MLLANSVLTEAHFTVEFVAMDARVTAAWSTKLAFIAELDEAGLALAKSDQAVKVVTISTFITTERSRFDALVAVFYPASRIFAFTTEEV